ncbi:hypothetical protein [Hyphococcus luteus]|uniref:Uncharacterized protein n=1 Tax=Hyphococcus luteus TaxID=2058213 RepID=A0A2S7JZ01_9PROT|nr:hypothetical protein [Marinicaulis flavus]PQA85485.1 hypothetical protein CW354_21310 [Marinicaulis flavus]
MSEFLSSDIGAVSLIAVPAALAALVALGVTAKGLRGSGGAAFMALLLALVIVLALGAGAVLGVKEYALSEMIPKCEAEQQAAHQRGEALLLDCESEGLIVAFPVFSAVIALGLVFIGAAFIRLTRRS